MKTLLFVIPWTVQSLEFSRPEYWSGQLLPSPGDLPNPGIKPGLPALQADSLPAELSGKLSIKELLDKGETNLEQKRDNEMKTLHIRIYGTRLSGGHRKIHIPKSRAVITEKFTFLNTFMNNDWRRKTNELSSQLNNLGKEPQNKLKESTRNNIRRSKAEKNKLENREKQI